MKRVLLSAASSLVLFALPAIAADTAVTKTETTKTTTISAQPAPSTDIQASKLMNAAISDKNGVAIGPVSDILFDPAGQLRGVVVDVGAYLGHGNKPVMLEWSSIKVTTTNGQTKFQSNIDKTTLQQKEPFQQAMAQ